jgi:hypothetical protein
MLQFIGNNVYFGIDLIGFILSLFCFLINVILIRLIEYRFVIYIKGHHRELWQKYTDYNPRMWWRFLSFVRPLKNTGDDTIEKLRIKTLRYEKFAMMTIISVVVFFALMIVTIIIIQHQGKV